MNLRTLRLGVLGAAVVGAISAVVFTMYLAGVGRTTVSSEGDWPDYYEIQHLVADSDLIVLARFVGEEQERVEIQSPVMESSGVFRDDVLREYEAREILKGSLEPGERFLVWKTEGIADPRGMRGQNFGLTPAIEGEQYVLFLRSSMREEQPIWGRTGEPEKAQVDGNTLTFIASSRYEETARDYGHTFP